MRKLFLSPDEFRAKILGLNAPFVPSFTVFLENLRSFSSSFSCYSVSLFWFPSCLRFMCYSLCSAIVRSNGAPLLGDGMINFPRMLKLGLPLAEFAKYPPSLTPSFPPSFPPSLPLSRVLNVLCIQGSTITTELCLSPHNCRLHSPPQERVSLGSNPKRREIEEEEEDERRKSGVNYCD